jgi:hypothetical protein
VTVRRSEVGRIKARKLGRQFAEFSPAAFIVPEYCLAVRMMCSVSQVLVKLPTSIVSTSFFARWRASKSLTLSVHKLAGHVEHFVQRSGAGQELAGRIVRGRKAGPVTGGGGGHR